MILMRIYVEVCPLYRLAYRIDLLPHVVGVKWSSLAIQYYVSVTTRHMWKSEYNKRQARQC